MNYDFFRAIKKQVTKYLKANQFGYFIENQISWQPTVAQKIT